TDTLIIWNPNGFNAGFQGVTLILPPGVDPTPPRFTSAESVHSFYEAPFDFRVVTTGGSGTPAQLSVNWLPDGVAFKDNGDGTANISGKIPSGFALICTGGGACPIVSFITAKNTWGSTTQKF